MHTEVEAVRQNVDQIRDARDLLTRLYREIGISAVAAALSIRKEKPQTARPSVAELNRLAHEDAPLQDRAA